MSVACSACGHENSPDNRFCGQCGTRLAVTCPACGTANAPEDRFCVQCSGPLRTGATPTQQAAPAPATATLEREGERKQLTVLFADVQGSMDLQENLDPEAWAGIMGRFVQILAEGVRRFGGMVDKFTGDGIMALFGAPVAQEDHARRACHAAWHLTGAIAAYAAELRQSQDLDLHVRLGLNSGEVVVGRVGEDVQLDPTALGHTVGLAQRMEAMAEPGTAYLTEHTARLVEGYFPLKALGPMTVKGSRQPLDVFVLEGPAPASLPATARAGRALGASRLLVGRDRELAVLEDALAAAAGGRAQVVGVVGEAGVGKSRVCEEFARSAVARGITVRRTAGVSHGQDVPLLPVLALLRDYFGITEADGPGEAREKIAVLLLDLDSAFAEDLPLWFDLLEVPEPGHSVPVLAPEVRMRRIFEVLRRESQRRSEREVLVMIVEDLHWFDPQSRAFLERLVESYPGTRTLVVTNFRPEFSAPWMRHSYCRQLPLAPLPDEAVGELLKNLLGTDASLAPLLGFVLERTGGNAFFVEEVVRALIEDGTLAGGPGSCRLMRPLKEIRVPPSVQAVLAARIDRLPSEHKRVLQTAAVIGRTFPAAVLAEVTGLAGDALDDSLAALCGAELLQEAGGHPVPEYRFWHPLTQEVAYGSLLSERRATLHGAVARALEGADPARVDERAALIAAHYDRAGEQYEAAVWEYRAAAWVAFRHLEEAIRRWKAALEHLSAVPQTEEALRLGARIRTQLVRIGVRAGMPPEESQELARDARQMAEQLGDDELLGYVEFSRALELYLRGSVGDGFAAFLEAARLADVSGDLTLQVVTSIPSLIATYVGPLSEGFRLADRLEAAVAGDPDIGSQYLGYSALIRTGLYRAELVALSGAIGDAYAGTQLSLQQVRERGEAEGTAWAMSFLAELDDLSGEDHEGRAAEAAEAVRIMREIGSRALQALCGAAHGLAELADGHYDEAVAVLEETLAFAREQRVGLSEEPRLLAHLARAHLARGGHAQARAVAGEAVEVARRIGARVLECYVLIVRARIRRVTAGGDEDRAAAATDLAAALTLADETGAAIYAPFIHEERGRLHGDERSLHQALRLFSAAGAGGHARRLEAELAAAGRTTER